jgi:hypothetical protein
MEDIHGVNDHRTVGRFLADRLAKLLNGLEGMVIEYLLPGVHVNGGPIPINPPDRDLTVTAGFHKHLS